MFKRILVPHDGSAFAERVLPHVLELAKQFSSEIHLLEVVPAQPPALLTEEAGEQLNPEAALEALDQVQENIREAGRKRLKGLATNLQRDGFVVRWAVVDGDPVHEILAYADQHQIELIAMASHGRTGLARAILGSTTDAVLRRANQTMLITPVREP